MLERRLPGPESCPLDGRCWPGVRRSWSAENDARRKVRARPRRYRQPPRKMLSSLSFLHAQYAGVVDDFPANDREDRTQFLQRFIWNVEVIVARHDQVGELALFDRPKLVFLLDEPAVRSCVKSQRFIA